jgi:hypothetical protein
VLFWSVYELIPLVIGIHIPLASISAVTVMAPFLLKTTQTEFNPRVPFLCLSGLSDSNFYYCYIRNKMPPICYKTHVINPPTKIRLPTGVKVD